MQQCEEIMRIHTLDTRITKIDSVVVTSITKGNYSVEKFSDIIVTDALPSFRECESLTHCINPTLGSQFQNLRFSYLCCSSKENKFFRSKPWTDQLPHGQIVTSECIHFAPFGSPSETFFLAVNYRYEEMLTTSAPTRPPYFIKSQRLVRSFDEERSSSDLSRQKKTDQTSRDTAPCWFCLGNQKCETHLIISVGKFSYLALSKGPIGLFHILLIPIRHISNRFSLNQDEIKEIKDFINSLTELFTSLKLEIRILERQVNFLTTAVHWSIQVIGLPESEFSVPSGFIPLCQKNKMKYVKLDHNLFVNHQALQQKVNQDSNFFILSTNDKTFLFVNIQQKGRQRGGHRTRGGNTPKFPLYFGRELLVVLHGMDRKFIQWRNVTLDKVAETKMVQDIRIAYKKHDCVAQ